MRYLLFLACMACAVTAAAQTESGDEVSSQAPAEANAAEAADEEKIKNPLLKKHLLENVDIFGKSDLSAIYIFGPGDAGAENIDANLITRDFVRDAFLMQNIDREEFEWKVVLRTFSEEKEEKEKRAEP